MFLFYVFVKLNTVFCISLEKELERKTMAYLVKSVGYVAQWKLNVNNLDQNEPKHISNTFKIDMELICGSGIYSLSLSLFLFCMHRLISQFCFLFFIPPGE